MGKTKGIRKEQKKLRKALDVELRKAETPLWNAQKVQALIAETERLNASLPRSHHAEVEKWRMDSNLVEIQEKLMRDTPRIGRGKAPIRIMRR